MSENTLPKRIIIFPEYGKTWTGTVLRSYNHNTIAVINPDGQDSAETVNVDLEFNGWMSLDNLVKIPDNITSEHDYLFYQAIVKEHNL
jgi:hypothetical protein